MNGDGRSDNGFRLVKAFTPSEMRIGAGIIAGLSYSDMGRELGKSQHTVRAQVITMHHKIIGLEDLPPRWAVYVVFKFPEWEATRPEHP